MQTIERTRESSAWFAGRFLTYFARAEFGFFDYSRQQLSSTGGYFTRSSSFFNPSIIWDDPHR